MRRSDLFRGPFFWRTTTKGTFFASCFGRKISRVINFRSLWIKKNRKKNQIQFGSKSLFLYFYVCKFREDDKETPTRRDASPFSLSGAILRNARIFRISTDKNVSPSYSNCIFHYYVSLFFLASHRNWKVSREKFLLARAKKNGDKSNKNVCLPWNASFSFSFPSFFFIFGLDFRTTDGRVGDGDAMMLQPKKKKFSHANKIDFEYVCETEARPTDRPTKWAHLRPRARKRPIRKITSWKKRTATTTFKLRIFSYILRVSTPLRCEEKAERRKWNEKKKFQWCHLRPFDEFF